jgi:hypothetical protein
MLGGASAALLSQPRDLRGLGVRLSANSKTKTYVLRRAYERLRERYEWRAQRIDTLARKSVASCGG